MKISASASADIVKFKRSQISGKCRKFISRSDFKIFELKSNVFRNVKNVTQIFLFVTSNPRIKPNITMEIDYVL